MSIADLQSNLQAQDVLEVLPYELAARLAADDYFTDITVVVAREGDVRSEAEKLQAYLQAKNGKRGIAVIVLQVDAEDPYPELEIGPLKLMVTFQVIEQVELNRGKEGTGKSARQVARRVQLVTKTAQFPGLVESLLCPTRSIYEVSPPKETRNVVMLHVDFECYEADFRNPVKQVSSIGVDQVSQPGYFILSCSTPGATIVYTLDGSSPVLLTPDGSQNPGAQVYSEPVAIPNTFPAFRACGYLKGMLASFQTNGVPQ